MSGTALAMLLCRSVIIAILLDLLSLSFATRTAFVEIVVCDNTDERSMYTDKLQGTFANIGTLSRAQGDVLQISPFGLCNISNGESLYDDEWVGVVKLTVPSRESPSCNDTVQKALGAVKKGAKAVIFDVTDSPGAAAELNSQKTLIQRPVIIISGKHARKLMTIVRRQNVLKARISWKPRMNQTTDSSGEYVDMVIFMTCFILITITCFILLLKIKWKQTKKESSLAKMAYDAVSKMESKKYEEKREVETVKKMKEKQHDRALGSHSCSVVGISCVICLEPFRQGQEIRIVSCGHEFHLKCVDPWLLTNYTCPLCMLNIVEREGNGIKTESRCSPSIRSVFRCCFASSPLSSSSMVYSITLEDSHSDNLSIATNDMVDTTHYNDSTPTSDNLWTERVREAPEGCRQAAGTSVPHLSTNSGRSTAVLNSRNADILQNSLDRNDLNVQENERWKENRTRAVQIAELAKVKYTDLGDAV
ncbi:E3 ubiquitin-protein ligase znrf3-like [Dendronephthya gigantea]|uniref:E3 ubiquitin-protein ligase znrf3-like n=1 Tax=Dendronephthya gigantea TaxID=151771 RepID=UPI00106C02B4|nr:E3 ubiquitin-protein ligase znrf3-like [Dendronephthya gigantea]